MAVCAVQPSNADSIAFPQMCNTRPERDSNPRSFVSRREGKIRLHRPIAVGRMQVSVADSACDNLHQGLPWPRLGYWDLSQHQRIAELFDDGCLHVFWDRHISSSREEWVMSYIHNHESHEGSVCGVFLVLLRVLDGEITTPSEVELAHR